MPTPLRLLTLPLTQHELDELQCERKDCDHAPCERVPIFSSCHSDAGIRVSYVPARGVLQVCCGAPGCGQLVAEIEVSP